jgi:MFS family permease
MTSSTANLSPMQRAAGLATLVLVPSLTSLAYAGVSPILAHISDELARTPTEIALVRAIVTTTGGALAVGALGAGFLAARFGTRTLLISSILLFALAGSAGYLLSNVLLLIATRILVGLSCAAIGVAAIAILVELVPPEKRNKWIGFYAVSSTLGGLVLIGLAGKVGSIDWRYVFVLHLVAVPMAVLAALFIPSFENPNEAARGKDRPSQKLPVGVLLFGLSCGVVLTTLAVYLPFHYKEIGLPDPKLIASTLIVYLAAHTVVAFGYGWVRRYLGVTSVFALAFLLMAGGFLGAAFATTWITATIFIFFSGVGGGFAGPNLVAWAANCAPEQRAIRTGWARAGIFGAPLIIQIPMEPVVQGFGGRGALLAIAAFALVMIPIYLLNRRMFEAGEYDGQSH